MHISSSMKRQRSFRGTRQSLRSATMVSAWFGPGANPRDVTEQLRKLSNVSEIYAWYAEFDEVHALAIFSEPCGLTEQSVPGSFLLEGVPSWLHGYYRESAASRESVHWHVNAMELE